MELKLVQLLSVKSQQATVQKRKPPVQRLILNINMLKLSIKKEKGKKIKGEKKRKRELCKVDN